MYVSDGFWTAVTYLTKYLSFSPYHNAPQQPISGPLDLETTHSPGDPPGYPIFKPPGGRPDWAGSDFECVYPEMRGWEFCSTPEDRECWLRNPRLRKRYDILTDYENDAPKGIERKYDFEITDGTWNTDGLLSTGMKLVNGQYPGPWVQACWGDTIVVNVTNKLAHNGTAIHWHGIRQNFTMHMDGVPGITQCPIAPGDWFVYKFKALQYGSSWYHSHYSVQYADGMLGPMTLHGPSTAPYDEPKTPLLMTDWFHNSSFAVIHGQVPGYGSILLNGTGDITKFDNPKNPYPKPDQPIPKKYQLHFDKRSNRPPYKPKKYLLRLINTAFSTSFAFSIDHHQLLIIAADFVPVIPSARSHVLVGIGQRYNVIVTADPIPYNDGVELPSDGNFWIRTTVAKCFRDSVIGTDGYDTNGILRYDPDSDKDPSTSQWPDIPKVQEQCRDETNLTPKLPWLVGKPSNGNGSQPGELFGVNFTTGDRSETFPLATWAFEPDAGQRVHSLQIDYSKPIFLHLDHVQNSDGVWPGSWVVIPENLTKTDWVYLVLAGPGGSAVANHPIHLHGHDFALLEVSTTKLGSKALNLTLDNPMRRDVVFLPGGGYVVIAFKADNPGSWIMHCHIAYHASEGLALQILERQDDADRFWPKPDDTAIVEAERVCSNWNDWHSNCKNYWPGYSKDLGCYPSCPETETNKCSKPQNKFIFMDDSGI